MSTPDDDEIERLRAELARFRTLAISAPDHLVLFLVSSSPRETCMPEHKITALQLFELAESLVADYDEPKLCQARAVFADLAEKECSGTLLARDAMIGMALAATGHMYDISEISDAGAPSPGVQTGATDGE